MSRTIPHTAASIVSLPLSHSISRSRLISLDFSFFFSMTQKCAGKMPAWSIDPKFASMHIHSHTRGTFTGLAP